MTTQPHPQRPNPNPNPQPDSPAPIFTPAPAAPDYPEFINNRTTFLSSHYLAYLSVILIGMNIVANILGAQMWRCGPILLDCGVFVYPLVYISLDVINEVYREKIANRIVCFACIVNVICIIAFAIAGFALRRFGVGADNTVVLTVFGFSSRVFAASTVSFAVSSITINNRTYEKLRSRTESFQIGFRAFVSSFLARILDSAMFTIIAFYGRTTDWNLLGKQFIFSLLVAWAIELCCTPAKSRLASKLKSNLGIE